MPWIIPVASMGISAIQKYKQGKEAQKNNNTDEQFARDQFAQQSRTEDAATELGNAQFMRETPGVQMGNSVRGDMLANLQPAKMSGSGRNLSMSGGLNPSLLSSNTRMLGDSMTRQAVLSALGGGGQDGMIEGRPDPYQLRKPPVMQPGNQDISVDEFGKRIQHTYGQVR